MQLTKNFAKALLPCVMACCQALAATPDISTEPVQEPAAITLQVNAQENANAQISYLEWRKRWMETRSETNMLTVQAVRFAAQPMVLQPV
jgi:hypothetical protein